MKRQLLLLGATLAMATASVPSAQASGCYVRADGTRYCSGFGGSAGTPFPGSRKTPRDRLGMHDPYGEPGYRLPPFGRGRPGITCYNIAGKPYIYKGGPRCPIS